MTPEETQALDRVLSHITEVHDLLMIYIQQKRIPTVRLPTQLKIAQALVLKLKENT